MSYSLDQRYPATATISELNRNLESNGCAMTKADPFNPEPGLPFNKWTEYTPDGGGVPELLWTGGWECKASEDVVVFSFRTRRPQPNAPTPAFEVKGAYFPGEQVLAVRKYVGGSGSRNLLMAITNLKSVDGLDAADSQFTYRFFPLSRGEAPRTR